jgi:hypothetical protein
VSVVARMRRRMEEDWRRRMEDGRRKKEKEGAFV